MLYRRTLSLAHALVCMILLLTLTGTDGVLVNITVDDTLPDPVTGNTFQYAPDGRWNIGGSCATCQAKPDPSSVHGGTWHDAMYSPADPSFDETQTAQIQFNGSAIYVFGVLAQSLTDPGGIADISFFIDGQLSGNFTYTPPQDNTYIYNFCLFSNDDIGPGTHTFELQNGRTGGSFSLILFDYIIYSQERDASEPPVATTATTTSSSSSSSLPDTTSSAPIPPPTVSTSSAPNPTHVTTSANTATSDVGQTSTSPTNTPKNTLSGTSSPGSATSFSSGGIAASSSHRTALSTSVISTSSSSGAEVSASPTADTNHNAPALTADASTSSDHVRTVVFASTIPSGIALLILAAWLLRRKNVKDRRLQRLDSSLVLEEPDGAEALHLESNSPAMRSSGGPGTSKERYQHAVHRVSSLEQRSPLDEAPQSVVDISGGSGLVASSEQGSMWRGVPRTPGGGSEAPPAYDTLSSAE